mgnify:CR=1 FL=1
MNHEEETNNYIKCWLCGNMIFHKEKVMIKNIKTKAKLIICKKCSNQYFKKEI